LEADKKIVERVLSGEALSEKEEVEGKPENLDDAKRLNISSAGDMTSQSQTAEAA